MSRLFPHAQYAEDQPFSRTFLTVHVLTRAISTGGFLGAAIAGIPQLIPSYRRPWTQFTQRLCRFAYNGTLVSIALSGAALLARMHGREEIEWQDRAWRLLGNEVQLKMDDWTYSGMLIIPAIFTVTKGLVASWKMMLGATSLGGSAGLIGYLTWEYGISRKRGF